MEKISSIIPSNNRISSVDLKEARPLRPGVVSHGQPVGSSEIVRFSKSALETVKDGQRTRSATEERNVKIVDALARKFFKDRATSVQKEETINPKLASEAGDEPKVEIPSPYHLGEDLFDSDLDRLERISTSAVGKSRPSSNDEDIDVKSYGNKDSYPASGSTVDKNA